MIKGIHITDQDILEGIRRSDKSAIEKLYREILPGIITYVQRNRGSEEDARDIFQEAMIVMYRKSRSEAFELTASLNTYISSICRNLWLKRLRDHKEIGVIEGIEVPAEDTGLLELMDLSSKRRLFIKHFQMLSDQCRTILELFFQKTNLKKIAEELETSEAYIKKRKFICKERVVKSIKNDRLYQELKA